MKREDKYPDNKYFCYHNENPKKRFTGDCVYRAIATATGIDYRRVVFDLAEVAIETGWSPASAECYGIYLKRLGWEKCKQPRKYNNKKYTGKEFCKLLNDSDGTYGKKYICHIGGHHIVCIKQTPKFGGGFKVNDIWDSTEGCIGNYWTK